MKIKKLTLKIALFTTLLNSSFINASELSANRSLFPENQGNINAKLILDQNETGDLYLAYRINEQGDFYFLDKKGFTFAVVPYENLNNFNGVIELPSVNTADIPPAQYQLYQVLVTTGTNALDPKNWIGNLRSLNFSVGRANELENDLDNDGWDDDDDNHNGFHDENEKNHSESNENEGNHSDNDDF